MSEYKFEVGREYKTRNGNPCVLLANDCNVGRVWKVLLPSAQWMTVVERSGPHCYKPVPPERTVDQWHHSDGKSVWDGDAHDSVPVRWTIGSDGKPAYAVRLDDNGEPMYRVEPVAKGAGDA